LSSIPIYTIGYGNRSINEFIELLKRYGIQYLVDVRSQPYSRYNPDFSKDALERHLNRHHIRYIFMGDTLGGRPEDKDSRTDDDIVSYRILRERDFYRRGIKRLHAAWEKELRIALMCSELRPQECHRGKLIGDTLIQENIVVAHIDESGNTKTQEEVNQFFVKPEQQNGQLTLFAEESEEIHDEKKHYSRKKYPPKKESA